jgi:hypothetical protein
MGPGVTCDQLRPLDPLFGSHLVLTSASAWACVGVANGAGVLRTTALLTTAAKKRYRLLASCCGVEPLQREADCGRPGMVGRSNGKVGQGGSDA